jgi:hypothetical protein
LISTKENDISIYISGPMSGYLELNVPTFLKAEVILREILPMARITNPANLRHFSSWQRCLVRDVKEMLAADVNIVVVLPGWKSSRGANIEVFLAMNIYKANVIQMMFDYEGNATFSNSTSELDFEIIQKS